MANRGSLLAYYSRQHHKDPGIVGFFGTGHPVRAADEKYDAYYPYGDKMTGPPNEGRNNLSPVAVSGLITIAGVPQPYFNLQLFNTSNPQFAYRGGRTDANGHYTFNWMLPGNYEITVRDPNMAYRTKVIHVGVFFPVFANLPIDTSMYVNEAFSGALASTSGQAPVVYTVSSGALPPEVTLNPDGTFTTSGAVTQGAYSGVFTATDAGGRTATQAFSVNVVPIGAAKYWRVYVSSCADGNNYCTMRELQLMATVGGANIAPGNGTAISSSIFADPAFDDDFAFDGITTSETQMWAASGALLPQYLGFNFTVPRIINQIKITARSTAPLQAPRNFAVQSSVDGITWKNEWQVYNQTGWTAGETRTFDRVAQQAVAVLPFDSSVTTDLSGKVWTATGTPTIDTVTKKFGAGSYKGAANSYVSTTHNDFYIGRGPFTIRGVVTATADPANNGIFATQLPNSGTGLGLALARSVGGWTMYLAGTVVTQAYAWVGGTQYDFELSRDDYGTVRLFIAGIKLYEAANAVEFTDTAMFIGAYYSASFAWPATGRIDDFARYNYCLHTDNFTPPTSAATYP